MLAARDKTPPPDRLFCRMQHKVRSDGLDQLVKGLPNKLIAFELGISVVTVKAHIGAILRGPQRQRDRPADPLTRRGGDAFDFFDHAFARRPDQHLQASLAFQATDAVQQRQVVRQLVGVQSAALELRDCALAPARDGP